MRVRLRESAKLLAVLARNMNEKEDGAQIIITYSFFALLSQQNETQQSCFGSLACSIQILKPEYSDRFIRQFSRPQGASEPHKIFIPRDRTGSEPIKHANKYT